MAHPKDDVVDVPAETYEYLMEMLFGQFSEEYYASGWFAGLSQSERMQEEFTDFIRSGISEAQRDYVKTEMPTIKRCFEVAVSQAPPAENRAVDMQTVMTAGGAKKAIMLAPYDDEMDAPTRRYMVISEIEERYNLLYEAIDEEAAEVGGQMPWSAEVRQASAFIASGAELPPFAELPADVRESIWVHLDTAGALSQHDLSRIIQQLRKTESAE